MLGLSAILLFIIFMLLSYNILGRFFMKPNMILRIEKYLNPNNTVYEEEKVTQNIKVNPRRLLEMMGESIGNDDAEVLN